MGKALGFVEVQGVVAAVDALDIMLKSAEVELATWERKMGGRLVTIIVRGEVAAVKAAVEDASENAIRKPVATGVIPNPHPEIEKLIAFSASRFMKAEDAGDSGIPGIPMDV